MLVLHFSSIGRRVLSEKTSKSITDFDVFCWCQCTFLMEYFYFKAGALTVVEKKDSDWIQNWYECFHLFEQRLLLSLLWIV